MSEDLQYSGRTLAFLGDAVWSLKVRLYLIEHGQGRGDMLQKMSVSYVSARAQAAFYTQMHEEGFLNKVEEMYFHRGRNSHAGSVPHNTPVALYRLSTGFEAMIGALQMDGQTERIDEIFDKAVMIREEAHA